MNTVFDGEAVDPVTGEIYQFNSKTGARKWKDPLKQMPKWTEPSLQGAAAAAGWEPASISKEGDWPSGKAPAQDSGLSYRSKDVKLDTRRTEAQPSQEGLSSNRKPESKREE
ncbi:Hypothetical predicted protein [Marmota monax]|uniref:WW domain-containing protein n=2 Tax=Marmota monax TaxID=9995 RepID=A0A5E4C7P9_MARMO|nr:Hypothetical predicted protein [Marmota monax]